MVQRVKAFLAEAYRLLNEKVEQYSIEIMAMMLAFIVILLVFGCAGTNRTAGSALDDGQHRGSYVSWEAAPGWMARDFLKDNDGWGLIDGREFKGVNNQDCWAIKVDKPVADGICDHLMVVCQRGVA